jgi:hypothetical protein
MENLLNNGPTAAAAFPPPTNRIDAHLDHGDDGEAEEEAELAADLGHEAGHRRGHHFLLSRLFKQKLLFKTNF